MATPGQANSVTAEEINQSLLRIAAFDKRSSPAVQSLASSWSDPDGIELLINLYQRLKGREAKWLTRLILKSYAPIKFPDNLEPGPQHSFLPACVQLKLQFPRASAPPVRRDGARVIIGIGSNDSSIGLSTPSRTAQQSSSPALPLITSADQPPPTPTASFPQPASSAPAPSLILSHPASSTPASLMLTLSVSAALRTLSTPVSSLPIPTPTVQHTRCSTLISTPSSHLVARASPHNHPSTPSRTALGPISHNIPTSSPKRSPMRSSPGLSIFTGGSGTCRWTPHTCPLSTCVFVLGPCIAKVPYINEQLLGWHGSRFTTSIRALAHPSLQRRCSRTGRRFKKIALVESHCTQPTVDFLKRISSLNLMRKGKKELIEVYDWRLLECITKMDQGKQLTYDPWARCWICNI
jgi:hypothetical protein